MSSAIKAGTSRKDTILGIAAIAIWSTMIAVSRGLTENLGTFHLASMVFLGAGALGTALSLLKRGALARLRRLSLKHLALCGTLFVAYEIALYYSLGKASGRQQALEVGLINYLWIPCTFLFSIPLLKKRAGWGLFPGIVLALAGVFFAMMPVDYSLEYLRSNLAGNGTIYLVALAAAISWGLYSNFSRKLAPEGESGLAVALFLLATGLALLPLRLFSGEPWLWPQAWEWGELAYLIIFPTLAGYSFWDRAVRRGNIILVSALSYFIPLLSTLITAIALDIPLSANIGIACLLIIAGAFSCKASLRE